MTYQLGDGNADETLNVGGNGQPVQVQPTSTGKLGFFGTTPVARPTPAGEVSVTTAGSSNAVYRNTSFTGGTGSTAYTVGDLVAILKAHGLIKS